MSNLKQRLARAELKSGSAEDKIIYILRWAHGEEPPDKTAPADEESQVSGYTIRRYGPSTLSEHLKQGPDSHITLKWPEEL